MSLAVRLMIAAELVLSLAAAEFVTATISPVRRSALYGDPIELRLTLENTTHNKVVFRGIPPYMCAFADAGLEITSAPDTGRKPSTIPGNPWFHEAKPPDPVASLIMPGGLSFQATLGPSQTLSISTFLQLYVGDPDPGVYLIRYSVDCPTERAGAPRFGAQLSAKESSYSRLRHPSEDN